jgi:hypothetical protein
MLQHKFRFTILLGFLIAVAGFFTVTSAASDSVPSASVAAGSAVTGPISGGTTVSVDLANFATSVSPAVTVGGVSAISVNLTESVLSFVTPQGDSIGAKTLVVTIGSENASISGAFTYTAVVPGAPTGLAGVARNGQVDLTWTAPVSSGGAEITGYFIEKSSDNGSNFTTAVADTGSSAVSRTVDSLANGTTYVFRISAINSAGTGAHSTASSSLKPQGLPVFTSIEPSSGTDLGGTNVVVTGQNFSGMSGVTVGGVAATTVTVVSDTRVSFTTQAGTAGVVDVILTTPSGSTTATGQFTYLAIPTITNVSPFYGPLGGGTTIVITGTKLTGATVVTVGGSAVNSFTVDSSTQISAVVTAGSVGAKDVRVQTLDGSATKTDGFTYFSAPTITALSVISGPTTGGTSVVITGTNFSGTTAVTFGGVNATAFTLDSATSITATTPTAPGGSAGAVTVGLTNPGGAATRANGFTYVSSGNPIEIVLRDKGETQVQFHICHNLPNPTNLQLGMQIEFRIRQSVTIVAPTNANWLASTSPNVSYEPTTDGNPTFVPPADRGVSSEGIVMRYRPNQNPNVTAVGIPQCGNHLKFFGWFSNQTGSTGGVWEDVNGNPFVNGPALTPGTSYVLEATLLTSTRGPSPVHTTYRAALVTTMGGGCPIDAPDESLPAYPQVITGLDSENRVVHVATVDDENPWAGYSSVVSTAYTYPTWPGKTFAQVGYYFDPRTNDFGPNAVLGEVISGATVITQASMDACVNAGYTISMTVDPSSSEFCSIQGGTVRGDGIGACKVNVTATRTVGSGSLRLTPRSISSLTRSATFIVRPSDSPSGGGGGGGGSGGGGSSSGGSSGGGGSATSEVPADAPVSSPGQTPTAPINPVPPVQASILTNPAGATAQQIGALSPEQLTTIPPATFGALPPAAFKVLSPAQIVGLSPSQVAAIRPARAAALSASAVAALSPSQLAVMRPASVGALAPNSLRRLDAEQISSLPDSAFRYLKPAQVNKLRPTQLSELSGEKLAAIRPSSLRKMKPSTFKALTSDQLDSLTAKQKKSLTVKQKSQLSTAQR